MAERFSNSVLGIVGSPRRGGNTEILVDEILAGAKRAGAKTETVFLNKLEIGPCLACNRCKRNGTCAQQDDMPALQKKMETSQLWVLGTPIYWWGPTAQFKAFIDRWYGQKAEKFAGHRVILAIPLGGGSPSYARHTVGMLTDIIGYLGMVHVATILAPGVSAKGDVRNYPEVIENANRTGREAVKMLN